LISEEAFGLYSAVIPTLNPHLRKWDRDFVFSWSLASSK